MIEKERKKKHILFTKNRISIELAVNNCQHEEKKVTFRSEREFNINVVIL